MFLRAFYFFTVNTTNKQQRISKRAVASAGILATVLFMPNVTHAYLSPSTISLIVASSGTVFVAAAALIFAYGIIAFSWIKRHKTLAVAIMVLPVLGLGGIAYGWYGEYQELKAINDFDASIVKDNEEWTEFINGFAADHAGINKDAFVQDDALSVANVQKIVPSTTFEQAQQSGHTLLGPYCEPVTFSGAQTSCSLGNLVLLNPTNEEKIHETMADLNISKEDPIVTFCDSGLRSSLTAMVLKQYGYNVQGRAQLYNYEGESRNWTLPGETRGSSSSTIYKNFTPQVDGPIIMFTAFRDRSSLDDRAVLEPYIQNDELLVLYVSNEHYTDEGENLDPLELPYNQNPEDARRDTVGQPYDIRSHISDNTVVCTTPLNCLSTRSYLEHIGIPQDVIYCIDCGSQEYKI